MSDAVSIRNSDPPRHAALVRVTHRMTAICFALLISGVEILISHPRFYCGETGNVLTRPLFFTVNGPDWLPLRAARPEWLEPVPPLSGGVRRSADRPRLSHLGIVDWPLPEQPVSCPGRQEVLFPLVIWTGLAMSPAFNSALPAAVNMLGGGNPRAPLHFFVSAFLLLFLIVYIAMVVLAGGCSFPSGIRFQCEVLRASQG